MTTQVPTLEALNAMSEAGFAEALAGIVEHAPAVAREAAASRPFGTVEALHAAMMAAIDGMERDAKIALIRNHPELAGREAASGAMTAESVSEQGGSGFDRLAPERARRLAELNAAYRARFGFPFLVCVRRHTVASVFAEAERRLGSSLDDEIAEAMRQILFITRLRIVDAVEGPGKPVTAGRLTTHVLDTVGGCPAEGVRIDLRDLSDGGPGIVMRSASTNADGRLDRPLVDGGPLRIGVYEILFRMGDYFRRRGYPLPVRPFLDDVPIRFGIAEPESHYHVPLAATPWSYSTYRGS